MSRFEDFKNLDTGNGCTIEDYIFIYGLITVMKPRRIIEIGTNTGVSAIVMASALKENNVKGKIYTIDISEDWLKIAKRQIKETNLEDYIVPILGTSDNVKDLHMKFDFGFIDGDHTYQGVKVDFENLKDRCNCILFHDISVCEGVTKFINELQGEKMYFSSSIKGTVYNLGTLQTYATEPGLALWRKS